MDKRLRIAIVHDNFAQMGGAERVAHSLSNAFPTAAMHSTLAARKKLMAELQEKSIQTTWMQHLPSIDKYYRHYFLLYPFAVQSINLSSYDVVISSCFGYAKGLLRSKNAIHICYCHTPMRWVWRHDDYFSRERLGLSRRTVLPWLLNRLKRWDLKASQRPDFFIANSSLVADRIREYYRREAVVIPPPIDVHRFTPLEQHDDFYLVVSRLSAYKRIDLAVDACCRLKRRLLVIGNGPDRERLQRLAGPTVQFLGRQSDAVVAHMLGRCRALISPGEDDFGMAPLEANASGRPVIAYKGGGALETVVDSATGVLFERPEALSLAEAIVRFESLSWNTRNLRKHAEGFSEEVFKARMVDFVSRASRGLTAAIDGATAQPA